MMRVLDLFSGIGAFSLGLERAGMTTTAFCEIDPFCRRVLAKHWPRVPIYPDVRHLSAQHLTGDGHRDIDLICGGFPCQDISVAGRGAGIGGERSGLWSEFARLIGEVGPRYVIVENVAALLGRGLGDVLGDLASLGYDAEWHCIPASAVGAPHERDRVWIMGHANGTGCQRLSVEHRGERHTHSQAERTSATLADTDSKRAEHQQRTGGSTEAVERDLLGGCCTAVADAGIARLATPERQIICGSWWRDERRAIAERSGWSTEPDVGRVADGVASRVDRLRGLGNSLVPQIPEIIGRAIMAYEASASERAA
jgi:DNA (cytosine-5)-methyltransferase 1